MEVSESFVRDALLALPVTMRTVYIMRRMAHASESDIAESLVLPVDSIADYIEDAEKKLALIFSAAGYESLMGEALTSYLTLPDSSDIVSRVMKKIRELPPHSPKKRKG